VFGVVITNKKGKLLRLEDEWFIFRFPCQKAAWNLSCMSVFNKLTIFIFVFRQKIKCVFNKQFGSVFRTYHNPTYFSRRLFRFADIYMSCLTNLLNYSVNHTFYPRRGVMPHEYTSYFVWTLVLTLWRQWLYLSDICFSLLFLSSHNSLLSHLFYSAKLIYHCHYKYFRTLLKRHTLH
jgi:hypothetical protein